MQRYQVHSLEQGGFAVIDARTGNPVDDASGSTKRTRLEAQALADFRNGIHVEPRERVLSRIDRLRTAWGLLTAKTRR